MIVISVAYPKTADSYFDYDYYLGKHMPVVRSRWRPMGMIKDELFRGATALDGSKPVFELLGLLTFSSKEEAMAALAAHGDEIIGDVPNFTNTRPHLQMNDPVS